MQWTEYCQNLSAAVFHAPRQMSRAIKARELAPKFSAVVVAVVVCVALRNTINVCAHVRDALYFVP